MLNNTVNSINMSATLAADIFELLNNHIVEDLKHYKVSIKSGVKNDGFMSEMCFVSLLNESTKQEISLAVKQTFSDEKSSVNCLSFGFDNEIYFYEKLWPSFHKFQESVLRIRPFDKIPKCFGVISGKDSRKIVMENLTYAGFQMYDKKLDLPKKHIERIFETYGQYHAISLAYRKHDSEQYFQLMQPLKDVFASFLEHDEFRSPILSGFQNIMNSLDPKADADFIKKLQKYSKQGDQIFEEALVYTGDYPVMTHGDCWSNNIMYKYDESNTIIDMRLLDFQLIKNGTPVYDLSYCLYSGAAKDVLDDLDELLKVYHASLCRTLTEFGSDPEKLYPFEILKDEWKKYCIVGYIMSLGTWKIKLSSDGDGKYDEQAYLKKTKDTALHMYENNFL